MRKPSLFLVVFVILMTLAGMVLNRYVPAQHLPWRKLNPAAPIGFATKTQFLRLSLSPSSICMDMAHDIDRFESSPAEPKRPDKTCGWDIARVVYSSQDITLTPDKDANMQCPLSIGVFMWLREIDQIARQDFGEGLKKIHHVGTYSCRRQNGNNSGQWSEHAFANAWDITGFEFESGMIISVQKDWDSHEKQRKDFLRKARDKACRIFRVTLSPDYNAAHYDHFHLDMGPSTACR